MCLCHTFLIPAFPYSPSMKYLLTESKRFVRRDLKTRAMMDGECVLTQSWTESHSICHRLLQGCNQIGYLRARCVVMTSNHSVCFHESSHWDYYPPFIQVDKMCARVCVPFNARACVCVFLSTGLPPFAPNTPESFCGFQMSWQQHDSSLKPTQ